MTLQWLEWRLFLGASRERYNMLLLKMSSFGAESYKQVFSKCFTILYRNYILKQHDTFCKDCYWCFLFPFVSSFLVARNQVVTEQQERDQAVGREVILEQELRAERRRRIDMEAQVTLADSWKARVGEDGRCSTLYAGWIVLMIVSLTMQWLYVAPCDPNQHVMGAGDITKLGLEQVARLGAKCC